MKKINIVLLIIVLIPWQINAQEQSKANKEFYKNGTAPLVSKVAYDSSITKMNLRLQKINSKIMPVIISETQSGDSTIYNVQSLVSRKII